MRELGATEDEIDELLQEEDDDGDAFEVLPENWEALQLYQSIYGKFLTTATGHVLGFDYNALRTDIELSAREVSPETWQKFKVLERLTANLLNQRKPS